LRRGLAPLELLLRAVARVQLSGPSAPVLTQTQGFCLIPMFSPSVKFGRGTDVCAPDWGGPCSAVGRGGWKHAER
jgi:hypothetical protein